jgi:hypothetical protein
MTLTSLRTLDGCTNCAVEDGADRHASRHYRNPNKRSNAPSAPARSVEEERSRTTESLTRRRKPMKSRVLGMGEGSHTRVWADGASAYGKSGSACKRAPCALSGFGDQGQMTGCV